MVQRFTISRVSLIMIKLFRGWELVNNATRLSLNDAQHALLLFVVIRVSSASVASVFKFLAFCVPERLNAKLATLFVIYMLFLTFVLGTGPTRGGLRGYIVPGPRGARKSSGVRV